MSIGEVLHGADGVSSASERGEGCAPPPIRGRDAELGEVAQLIRSVAGGRSGVLVVRAHAGVGKSRLLQEAGRLAERAGHRVVVARPDPDSHLIPLASLLDAVTAGPDPIVSDAEVRGLAGTLEAPYWLIGALQGAFESAAESAGGVVVVVDDLHWCDSSTLAVLRALIRRLGDVAVGWILAVRSGQEDPAVVMTVDLLTRWGSVLELHPLNDDAVVAVVTDLLGGEPDATVLAVAERAERVPLLLVELAQGLLDEHLIHVTDGRAVMLRHAVPRAFGTSVRQRLRRLSPAGQHVMQLGALLGRRFAPRPLTVLLGVRAAELVPGIQDAISAGLVVERDDGFEFRHDVYREVAESLLPRALRRMLVRQAITELLHEGEPLLGVVERLAEVTEPGDDEAVALIRDAALELAASNTLGAVGLAERALDLSPASPNLPSLLADLAPLIWSAGRAETVLRRIEAIELRLAPEQTARLALVVARLQSESSTVDALRTVASALQLPGVDPASRARLLAVRALNLAHSGAIDGIRSTMREARSLAESTCEESVVATLEATESVLAFYEWRFADADRWITSANRRIAERADAGSPAWLPEGLWLACLAASLGDRSRAAAAPERRLGALGSGAPSISAAARIQMQSRFLLDQGRLSEARAIAESIVETKADAGPDSFMAVTAGQTLFRIALAQADRPSADRYRRFASTGHHSTALHRAGRWLLALEAESRGDLGEIVALTDDTWRTFELPVASMSNPPDFVDDVVLTRMYIRAGVTDRLAVIDRVASARADANPTNDLCAGVASHVRGLIRCSLDDLETAVARFRRIDRPLVLASALEDLGRAQHLEADDDAWIPWSEAEQLYAAAGAGRDEDRVRRRLRSIGVRRRGVAPSSENGLTHRELQVAERVAAGLTTPQIASDLSISTHTVVTHVRHVYAKWGVASRRELRARFVRGLEAVP